MRTIAFRVYGTPAPQGSKRHVGNGVMVESSKAVKPWRADVVNAARQAIGEHFAPLTEPVRVYVNFTFARPKSHFGTGRNAETLKDSAPFWVTSRAVGDLDKLQRSTLDALVAAGVLADDSLVADIRCTKSYCQHPAGPPGAFINIEEIA